MKRISFATCIILLSLPGVFAQTGNGSDGTIPPGVPPPPIKLENCYGVPYNTYTHQCDCICGIIPKTATCKKHLRVNILSSKEICIGETTMIRATATPIWGKYSVSTDNHFMRLTQPTVIPAEVRALSPGWGTVTVSYSKCGETVSAKQNIHISEAPTVIVPSDTIFVCPGASEEASATGLPAGGTYSWTAGPGVKFTTRTDRQKVFFKSSKDNSSVTVTYKGCKDSTATKTIQVARPSVVFDVPDTIHVSPDTVITINPAPQGLTRVQWKVSQGLNIIRRNHDAVTIKVTDDELPAYRTATLTGRMCNKDTFKTVTIYVNTCKIKFIDVNKFPKEIKVGDIVHITAIGNRGIGKYEWTILSGNMAIVNMTENNAVVQIKGIVPGPGKAEVAFKAADCSTKRTIDIMVVP